MGVTYKTIDTNRDAPVALKVINAFYTGSDSARERFIHKARAAASLRQRNVVNIHQNDKRLKIRSVSYAKATGASASWRCAGRTTSRRWAPITRSSHSADLQLEKTSTF